MPRKNSIGLKFFQNVRFLIKIPKFSKNLEKLRKLMNFGFRLYELSEREPGRRFTARCHIELSQSGARDHENVFFHKNIIDKYPKELHDYFKLCIEDLEIDK